MNDEKKWDFYDVVDVASTNFVVRNYIEQMDVRKYLEYVSKQKKIESACEVGCGYGRITMVLREFASNVKGFEREDFFFNEAKRLIPDIKFIKISSLTKLNAESNEYDFVLTFTVLQHLIDSEVNKVINEIKRITKKGGYILLCEETDSKHVSGDTNNPFGRCTIGRSVETYQNLMAPYKLIKISSRKIEPGYTRKDVGTYMLFLAEDK